MGRPTTLHKMTRGVRLVELREMRRRQDRKALPAYGKAGIPFLPKRLQRTGEGHGHGPRRGIVRHDLRKRVPGDELVHGLLKGRAYTSVARVCGLPLRVVMQVLKGKTTNVGINTMVAMAAGLGCSVEELHQALVTMWAGGRPTQVAVYWGRARAGGEKGKVPVARPRVPAAAQPIRPVVAAPVPLQKATPAPPVLVPRRPSAVVPVEVERGYREPQSSGWGGYFEDD